jgi:kanamycin kinase
VEERAGRADFEVGAADERAFVKWSPVGGPNLAAEAERLEWARRHVVVPEVVALGADDEGTWLVSVALPGASAVDPRWIVDPTIAVDAIGEGLRALHDALPVDACPLSWSVATRGGSEADAPPIDQLVVCNGHACAPNTLLDERGHWIGHVDFGQLGTADRWADLAVATWGTVWNYGPGHEARLLDAYGVAPDRDRTEFSRWLWDNGVD